MNQERVNKIIRNNIPNVQLDQDIVEISLLHGPMRVKYLIYGLSGLINVTKIKVKQNSYSAKCYP